MITAPLILKVASYTQVLPAFALATRRVQSLPAKLVAGGYLFSWGTDLVGRYVGRTYGNSHWVSIASAVCFTSLMLWAYSEWQDTPVERLALRIAIVPFVLVFAVLVIAADGWTTFPRFSYPFSTVVTLGGALWTLLRRTTRTRDLPVLRTDWFLLLVGVALHAAVTTVTSPIAAVLLRYERVDLLVQIWQVRAVLVIISVVLISLGMLRGPVQPEPAA